MQYEKYERVYWVYSQKSISKLYTDSEDYDVWKLYLDKKQFKEAYEICSRYKFNQASYVINIFIRNNKIILLTIEN